MVSAMRSADQPDSCASERSKAVCSNARSSSLRPLQKRSMDLGERRVAIPSGVWSKDIDEGGGSFSNRGVGDLRMSESEVL